MADEDMVRFIAEHRGRFGEAALRERLIQDGYPPEEVDEALELAREVELLPESEPPPEGSGPRRLLLGLLAAGLLAACAYVGWKNFTVDRPSLPSSGLSVSEPTPLVLSSMLPFLKGRSGSGNAGAAYLDAVPLLGRAAGGGDVDGPLDDIIGKAARRRECAVAGVLWIPEDAAGLNGPTLFWRDLGKVLDPYLEGTAIAQLEDGDLISAEQTLTRWLIFSHHRMLEWDPRAQLDGAAAMGRVIRHMKALPDYAGGTGGGARLEALESSLPEYMIRPSHVRAIAESVEDPAYLTNLYRYLEERPLLRPYAAMALKAVIEGAAASGEIEAGRLDPRRVSFLRDAASRYDGRLGAVAGICLRAAEDLTARLPVMSREQRRRLGRDLLSAEVRL